MPKSRTHNKSNKATLSLLDHTSSEIDIWGDIHGSKVQGLSDSACVLVSAKDGRFTSKGTKVAYAYQISVFRKFGREQLRNVPTSKRAHDLVISHLCGTRNCCNENHIILESKVINDERTHCHFGARHAAKAGKLQDWINSQACPHKPMCTSSVK